MWERDSILSISLSDAFYYLDHGDDFHIFYNLSDVTNDDIIYMMKKAQKIVWKKDGLFSMAGI